MGGAWAQGPAGSVEARRRPWRDLIGVVDDFDDEKLQEQVFSITLNFKEFLTKQFWLRFL